MWVAHGATELHELEALLREHPRMWRRLWRFLYHPEDTVRWRAADALGQMVARQSEDRPELAREVLRRLFWAMNEESGSVCWGAPEAVGEILSRKPELCVEFVPVLVSHLSDRTLRPGVVRALARLGRECAAMGRAREALRPYLDDPDPEICAAAAVTLGCLQT